MSTRTTQKAIYEKFCDSCKDILYNIALNESIQIQIVKNSSLIEQYDICKNCINNKNSKILEIICAHKY